jgi:hypothetical protein
MSMHPLVAGLVTFVVVVGGVILLVGSIKMGLSLGRILKDVDHKPPLH